MLRRRVRSALYIDFENVPLQPDAVANWLAWLEDGEFEPARRKRRFLVKRVYWNSHAERHRQTFEQHGISAILVGKFSGLKNGADIRMAMDVVEATYTRPEIDEFILLTGDSDFVPVLQRLREKSKRTAIVATEHRPNIHTTYSLHADLLIPSRRLTEAAGYRRQPGRLLGRLFRRPAEPPPAPRQDRTPRQIHVRPAPAPVARPQPSLAAPPPRPAAVPLDIEPALVAALDRIVRLMAQQPHYFVAQRRVMAELDRIPGFKRQGPGALFGFATYRVLMRELARRDPRIKVIEQHGGGTGVVFVADPGQRPPATLTVVASADRPAPAKLVASEPAARTASGESPPDVPAEREPTALLPAPAAPLSDDGEAMLGVPEPTAHEDVPAVEKAAG